MGPEGQLTDILGVTDKVRILSYNVGGSFGMKAPIYPEYVPAHATRELGRPVKWTDERSGRSPTTTAVTTRSRSPRSARRVSL